MLPPRPFFFLRHGQTDWNAQGRIQGHTDVPLNATGVAQAQAAAGRLAGRGIGWIVSSPLARARATADFVAARLGLPVHLDDDLKERRFGALERMIADEVKRAHGLAPEQPINLILPPDAEQWPQTVARSRAVVAKWLTAHPGKIVLFVSHDGLFRALHEQLRGTRPGANSCGALSLRSRRRRVDGDRARRDVIIQTTTRPDPTLYRHPEVPERSEGLEGRSRSLCSAHAVRASRLSWAWSGRAPRIKSGQALSMTRLEFAEPSG